MAAISEVANPSLREMLRWLSPMACAPKLRVLALVGVSVMLSACSTSMVALGVVEGFNEVYRGTVVSAGSNEGVFAVVGEVSKVKCDGRSIVTQYGAFGVGAKGRARFTCSDGRRIEGEFVTESYTFAHGIGEDQNGTKFHFVVASSEEAAQSFLAPRLVEAKSRPNLPVYRPREVRAERGYATGTGFFVSADGLLVTNHHVIDGAQRITVVLPKSGGEVEARLLRTDPSNDLAILKIEAATTALPVGNGTAMRRGEEVIALGFPLVALQGQEQKATFGRVNALSGLRDDVRFLQIDVPIQPGNSGGPLINRDGEVIGIVTATLDQIVTLRASGALPQNVNFAVKSDYLAPLVRSIGGPTGLATVRQKKPADIPEVVANSEGSVVLVIAR